MSDTSGDLKWYLTPLFKWLNHVLKSPFILTGVSALRHRQTLQNPHPSWGVFIWELDPVSSQHHKNYLSKRDLQVPYREKGMIWILEVKIYRGYTCWRHQKRLWCAFLLLFWMKFRLWWPARAFFHALPHPAVEQATSQRTKIWSSVQRLEWCREMTSTWLSNIGFSSLFAPCSHRQLFSNRARPSCSPTARNHLGSQTHWAAQKPHPGCQKPRNPNEWAWLVPSRAPVTAVTHSQALVMRSPSICGISDALSSPLHFNLEHKTPGRKPRIQLSETQEMSNFTNFNLGL